MTTSVWRRMREGARFNRVDLSRARRNGWRLDVQPAGAGGFFFLAAQGERRHNSLWFQPAYATEADARRAAEAWADAPTGEPS